MHHGSNDHVYNIIFTTFCMLLQVFFLVFSHIIIEDVNLLLVTSHLSGKRIDYLETSDFSLLLNYICMVQLVVIFAYIFLNFSSFAHQVISEFHNFHSASIKSSSLF